MTRQANRAGRPWQRKDGRWAARAYPPGGGKPKMVYGTTEAEVTARQHEASAPAGITYQAGPPRPVRITVDLDPDRYAALNKWLALAAPEVSPDARRVSLARAVRAMVDVITLDKSVGLVVIDLLRREQGRSQ
jgi:hypothetical protein